jgi:hypothetical protein
MTEFELIRAEPLEPMSLGEVQSPPKAIRPPARTPHEALETLRQAEGAESAIARLPTLAQPEVWHEVAYFDVCETRGTAYIGVFVWDADFLGQYLDLFDAKANCYVYFAGAEENGWITPPSALTGQIWCHFRAPETGYYLFLPHAQTYVDVPWWPDYYAAVECLIDDHSFGQFQMSPGHHLHQPMTANLAATESPDPTLAHRFTMRQVTGGVFFWSLTIWNIPVLSPESN